MHGNRLDGIVQVEQGYCKRTAYRPPQLISLGSLQAFILGGPIPTGNDVANIDLDGHTS